VLVWGQEADDSGAGLIAAQGVCFEVLEVVVQVRISGGLGWRFRPLQGAQVGEVDGSGRLENCRGVLDRLKARGAGREWAALAVEAGGTFQVDGFATPVTDRCEVRAGGIWHQSTSSLFSLFDTRTSGPIKQCLMTFRVEKLEKFGFLVYISETW
jgi:hypothetical protein